MLKHNLLTALLSCRVNAAASSSSPQLSSQDYQLVSTLLQWPAAQLFPALDIARLVVLTSQGAQQLAGTSSPSEGASGELLATHCFISPDTGFCPQYGLNPEPVECAMADPLLPMHLIEPIL